MALRAYKEKRNFSKTPEPKAKKGKTKPIFVIQRHHATRLHYDFRLAEDGVLKSWAVPKGPSMNPSEKRLAVQTENHPMDYASFHGIIPEGNYGAGKVEIWDKGTFENITIKSGKLQPLGIGIEKGHFLVNMKGKRIKGGFALTRLKDKNWILVKMKDRYAQTVEPLTLKDGVAIINGKEIPITNPEKEIFKGARKLDLVSYYAKIAGMMVPLIKDRPISMFRFPDGPGKKGFFQKKIPDYFPKWFGSVRMEKEGNTHPSCSTKEELVYLAGQVCELHIGTSRKDKLEYPDRIVFDLDPSTDDTSLLRRTAKKLGKLLEDIGTHPFIMTTGGKGFHIVVPIERELKHDDVGTFALKIAQVLVDSDDDLTLEMSKAKRAKRIFIDTYRNRFSQTSVAPYTVRAKDGAPIAAPFEWGNIDNVEPKTYSLSNLPDAGDPWKNIDKKKVSLKSVIKKLKG